MRTNNPPAPKAFSGGCSQRSPMAQDRSSSSNQNAEGAQKATTPRGSLRPPFVPVKPSQALRRKAAACQTDPTVTIQEESLGFFYSAKLGDDGPMRRDYVKAVGFINSCHAYVNRMIEKRSGNGGDKSDLFLLPCVPNFAPLFGVLTATRSRTGRMSAPMTPHSGRSLSPEASTRSSVSSVKIHHRPKVVHSAVEPVKMKISPSPKSSPSSPRVIPAGPAPTPKPRAHHSTKTVQPNISLTNIVKDRINKFLLSLQEDFVSTLQQDTATKATTAQKTASPRKVSKELSTTKTECFEYVEHSPQSNQLQLQKKGNSGSICNNSSICSIRRIKKNPSNSQSDKGKRRVAKENVFVVQSRGDGCCGDGDEDDEEGETCTYNAVPLDDDPSSGEEMSRTTDVKSDISDISTDSNLE